MKPAVTSQHEAPDRTRSIYALMLCIKNSPPSQNENGIAPEVGPDHLPAAEQIVVQGLEESEPRLAYTVCLDRRHT
jgi:hypothetical protein